MCALALGLFGACGAAADSDSQCYTDEDVAEWLAHGSPLYGATLAGPQITDESLRLLAGPRGLPSLVLRGTTEVTDAGLRAVGESPHGLSYLALWNVPHLTHLALEPFTARSGIEELVLVDLRGAGDLFATAARMPGLRTLRIAKCPGMDDEALATFEGHASLRILTLWECSVSAVAIERFREASPGCELELVGTP